MARSHVVTGTTGGDYLMVPGQRYAYGRSAKKKEYTAIHTVRGRQIEGFGHTLGGLKRDVVAQTLKGSQQRRNIAKQLRALSGRDPNTLGFSPAEKIVKSHHAAMAAKGIKHRPAGSPRGGQFY